MAAPIGFLHRPGLGERVVNDGDLIVQEIRVGLVEIDAFADDGLVVAVQGQARGVEGPGAKKTPRLRDEYVKSPIAIFVDPLAMGRAAKTFVDVRRPRASIGVDAGDCAIGWCYNF